MTFWGGVLKPGEKLKIPEAGGVLHLSQATLHKPVPGKNYVQVVQDKKKYAVCCLEKGKAEQASLDLFLRVDRVGFRSAGSSEVHLTGYFEPGGPEEEGEDEDMDAAKA